MSESSEELLSDLHVDDIFGDSNEEEEFGGFDFSLPTNITLEEDNNGVKTHHFYKQNPCNIFRCDNAGPMINTLPGMGNVVDIFQLFLSNEMLEKSLDGQIDGLKSRRQRIQTSTRHCLS